MSWFTGLFKNSSSPGDALPAHAAGLPIAKGGPPRYSLRHLQYLYSALSKLQPVKPAARGEVVEILRAISEVIIYGDQRATNQIFDYFCEKNMLSLFTKMLRQRAGQQVNTQIVQTVSILVQNIRNETYLYYILSNNHVNEIIQHPFDFSDEELLAYVYTETGCRTR